MKQGRIFVLSFAVTLFSCAGSALAQSIITFAGTGYGAGTGTGSHTGDGGSCANATFFYPTGVASNGYSNLYVADQNNHVVRKINYTGTITTYAGTGTAGNSGDGLLAVNAKLNKPFGVAVDRNENVYVADYYSNVVRKINTSGVIVTIAGTGVAGYSGDNSFGVVAKLNAPYGVAVDADGNVYIADAGNNVIRKVDALGTITTVAGNGFGAGLGFGHGAYTGDGDMATNASLNYPEGVTIDNYGDLYIADANNNVVRKVNNHDGTISTVAGTGVSGLSGNGGPAVAAKLNFPAGVFADGHGNLYVADQGNNAVRKIDPSGTISALAGTGASGYSGDGGYASKALLNAPTSIAVDGSGLIYIADYANNVIRLVGYPVSVNSVDPSASANIFPNPSNGTFSVKLPTGCTTATILIEDLAGRNVETRTTNQTTENFSNIAPGAYFVKIVAGDRVFRDKIVVW